jgi:hypothetical protein
MERMNNNNLTQETQMFTKYAPRFLALALTAFCAMPTLAAAAPLSLSAKIAGVRQQIVLQENKL